MTVIEWVVAGVVLVLGGVAFALLVVLTGPLDALRQDKKGDRNE